MALEELRQSRSVDRTNEQGSGFTETRTRVWLGDGTPDEVLDDAECPTVGDEWNTDYEYLDWLEVTGINAERFGSEANKSTVTVTYTKKPGVSLDEDGNPLPWQHEITWEVEISTESQKVLFGRRDRPPDSLFWNELSNILDNMSDYRLCGKDGEGTNVDIPKMVLTINRDEPVFPSGTVFRATGSLNSNNNWVLSDDKYLWKFLAASATQKAGSGVTMTYRFEFDYNGHQTPTYKTKEHEGNKILAPIEFATGQVYTRIKKHDSLPLYVPTHEYDGTALASDSARITYMTNQAALAEDDTTDDPDLVYGYITYTVPAKDFDSRFDFWDGMLSD